MPRGSRNPVIAQRETAPAHRALRKLRATSSVMAPISFCTSRCLRCRILSKRHPAPHRTPLPRVAYPPQCGRFAAHREKKGLSQRWDRRWGCGHSNPVTIICTVAGGSMYARGRTTPWRFPKISIVAVEAPGLGKGAAVRFGHCFDRSDVVEAPEACTTMRDGCSPLVPRVLNAVEKMGRVVPAAQLLPHLGCRKFLPGFYANCAYALPGRADVPTDDNLAVVTGR
jgi:hypothetical protein